MPGATLTPASGTEDFEATLDYVSTVGYDVNFLRGDTRRLLEDNPISENKGIEHFDPRVAPLGAIRATGPWAARLLLGGETFIDELAGTATWSGSLDLQNSARRVVELTHQWMEDELAGEADMISHAEECCFPKTAPVSEQFYSIRDAVQFSEQWLPGSPTSRPALTLLLAFCIGVDEFLCPTQSLDTCEYLGRQMGELWDDSLTECDGRDDAAEWLAAARDALRAAVFLQNREKLVYAGLIDKDKDVFRDWNSTAHYMLRAEAGMTSYVVFLLCAYAGLPFREDLTGAVGIYGYANAVVLDFTKRATKLGAGSFTENALADKEGELQGRSHLIGAILSYGESVLPPLFLCVLRPFVLASSPTADVLDRYRERSWGLRLPVGRYTLCMMMAVMEGAQGSLTDDGSSSTPGSSTPGSSTLGSSTPGASSPCTSDLVAEVVHMLGAEESYDVYRARPSMDALYRLPRVVRLLLQMDEQRASRAVRRLTVHHGAVAAGSSHTLPLTQRMASLTTACGPPLPSAQPGLTKCEAQTSRLGAVRELGAADELESLALRSPARPGGYASGRREFTGRPVGSGAGM